MTAIPHIWRAYANLQQQAKQGRRANAQSWAIEACLDHLLSRPYDVSESHEDVNRILSTARRREVHRGGTLRRHAAERSEYHHPEASLHALLTLKAIRGHVTGPQWDILCDVGAGRSYEEIAQVRGGTPGRYRAQVLRVRRTLATGY